MKIAISFTEALKREVELDGLVVVIRTADMDQILALLGHVGPLQAELAGAPAPVMDAVQGIPLDDTEKLAVTTWLMGLLGRQRDAVRQVVAICAGLPVETVGKLLPDRFLALLLLSIEVNADFFSRMLLPLRDLAQRTALAGALGVAPVPPPSTTGATLADSASTGPAPSSS